MSEYRHCTNLQTPYDKIDQGFLDVLADYKVGEPVPAEPEEGVPWVPLTVDEMKAGGVVGIYTTRERLVDNKVKARTGWQDPDEILGRVLAA